MHMNILFLAFFICHIEDKRKSDDRRRWVESSRRIVWSDQLEKGADMKVFRFSLKNIFQHDYWNLSQNEQQWPKLWKFFKHNNIFTDEEKKLSSNTMTNANVSLRHLNYPDVDDHCCFVSEQKVFRVKKNKKHEWGSLWMFQTSENLQEWGYAG